VAPLAPEGVEDSVMALDVLVPPDKDRATGRAHVRAPANVEHRERAYEIACVRHADDHSRAAQRLREANGRVDQRRGHNVRASGHVARRRDDARRRACRA